MSDKKKFNSLSGKPKRDFQIFVDLDGVLSDFDGHARMEGKYNDKGQPKWNELTYDWWVSMPAYKGMKEFYEGLDVFGNVRMLTAPIMSADCFRGKAEWVEKQFGRVGLLDLIICGSSDKHFLARANHILIDDREKNIQEWVAAGGIGIHHKGNYTETVAAVRRAIDDFRRPVVPAHYRGL